MLATQVRVPLYSGTLIRPGSTRDRSSGLDRSSVTIKVFEAFAQTIRIPQLLGSDKMLDNTPALPSPKGLAGLFSYKGQNSVSSDKGIITAMGVGSDGSVKTLQHSV